MKTATVLAIFPFTGVGLTRDILDSNPGSLECASERFQNPVIPGATVLSIEAKQQENYTSPLEAPSSEPNDLHFCQVKVFVTHQTADDVSLNYKGTNDRVLIEIWLPLTLDDWNGRLQATGGSDFATGIFDEQIGAVRNGWASVSTDGGHDASWDKMSDASWALNQDRSLNWNLLHNFASRSLVDEIIAGKNIVKQYYGKEPHHSYWNGCSTGGRQGYAIAQKYPHLVDGILANAPAISFTHLITALFWPQLQMKMLDTYMSKCELDYYRAKSIESCDMLDGVHDGILEDPGDCRFDPYSIANGQDMFVCNGENVEFTKRMAQLVTEIHKGPGAHPDVPLFPGLAHGVSMESHASITVSKDGRRSQNPLPLTASWLKYIVFRDPVFDTAGLDMQSYIGVFGQASHELGGLMNNDDPDLSALQASGTKLLSWHGTYDQAIPYQNSVMYREKVEGVMGGPHKVNDYYRLFLAPGVDHCEGGIGPVPKDPLAALVDWVEQDIPPEVLEAETMDHNGELVTRELCLWPAKSKYMGIGSAKRASSWTCVGGAENPPTSSEEHHSGRAQQILDGLADRWANLGLGLNID